MFKNEIKNRKKLKPNGTFEFIDWDKNCDKKKKILRFEQNKDDRRQCGWMENCDNCIEFG